MNLFIFGDGISLLYFSCILYYYFCLAFMLVSSSLYIVPSAFVRLVTLVSQSFYIKQSLSNVIAVNFTFSLGLTVSDAMEGVRWARLKQNWFGIKMVMFLFDIYICHIRRFSLTYVYVLGSEMISYPLFIAYFCLSHDILSFTSSLNYISFHYFFFFCFVCILYSAPS